MDNTGIVPLQLPALPAIPSGVSSLPTGTKVALAAGAYLLLGGKGIFGLGLGALAVFFLMNRSSASAPVTQ